MPKTQSPPAHPEWYRLALHDRAEILRGLRSLDRGPLREGKVHRVRTACRRLQALLDLLGRERDAQAVARAAGRLSKIRALHVFRHYLRSRHASRNDLALLKDRILREVTRVRVDGTCTTIVQVINNHITLPDLGSDTLLAARIPLLRDRQLERLRMMIDDAEHRPRRKNLHALRLLIKQIRYQTEWLSRRKGIHSEFVGRLKTVQDQLGRYEELADFKRWAKKWDLRMERQIKKQWKRARRCARTLPHRLNWLPETLSREAAWGGGNGRRELRLG